MKRLFFLLLLGFQSVFAQESSFSYQGQIGLFNTAFNSKTILNSSGFWDTSHKLHLLKQLEHENYLLFQQEDALKYTNKKGWSISLQHKHLAYSSYTKDLAQLALYGNATLTGKNLSLAPFNTSYYRYSELAFGFRFHENFHLSTSAILGHQLVNIQTNTADFYTAENGSYIDYNLSLEAHYTDTTFSDIFGNRGLGAALGLYYEHEKEDVLIRLSANDIGFIRWDKGSTNLYIDTAYHFEGIAVNDLLNFNQEILENEIDALEGQINSPVQESYNWKIPILLRGYYEKKLHNNHFNAVSFGAEHRLGIYPTPLLYANLHHERDKSQWSFGYHFGGLERPGIQLSYFVQCKQTEFRLYTRQANLFLPEEIYGLHLGIGIKKVFLPKGN